MKDMWSKRKPILWGVIIGILIGLLITSGYADVGIKVERICTSTNPYNSGAFNLEISGNVYSVVCMVGAV